MKRWISAMCLALAAAGCAHAPASTPAHGAMREESKRPLHVELKERGLSLAAAGEDVRAEQYFAGALESGGDVDEILPLLLRVCVASERYEAALAYAERYQPAPGENLELDMVLAALQLGLGQIERARKNLEQILSQKKLPQAHYMLGELYGNSLQDYGAADLHYREYLALAPDGAHAAQARRSLLKTTESTSVSRPSKVRPKAVRR
jgi:tetratricopeptide (TPR) repeat protein